MVLLGYNFYFLMTYLPTLMSHVSHALSCGTPIIMGMIRGMRESVRLRELPLASDRPKKIVGLIMSWSWKAIFSAFLDPLGPIDKDTRYFPLFLHAVESTDNILAIIWLHIERAQTAKLCYQLTWLDRPELTTHDIKQIPPHPKLLHMTRKFSTDNVRGVCYKYQVRLIKFWQI